MIKKKILIVDDSALMRRIESDIINSDDRFTVVGTCSDGLEAYDLVTKSPKDFDLILMDINMPKMTGLEFLAAIQKFNIDVKIIIISSLTVVDSKETIQALELGAFDCIAKPESFADIKSEAFRNKVRSKAALALKLERFSLFPDKNREEVEEESGKVVSPMNAREILANIKKPRKPHISVGTDARKLVLIASSTGGPKALHEVIPKLPKNLNAPVLLVQHMAQGFTDSLAVRLNQDSNISVVEAKHGQTIQKGVVYIAKGGTQMRLKQSGMYYTIDLDADEPPRNALKPCADILFESIAGMEFDEIICCVLTGMGGDGTMGIHALAEKNNVYVIAQDEKTSTVYGMPKVVYEAGLTDTVKPLNEIAQEITKSTGVLNYGC